LRFLNTNIKQSLVTLLLTLTFSSSIFLLLRYQKLERIHDVTYATTIASIGKLAGIIIALDGTEFDAKKQITYDTKLVITQLTLLLISSKVNVEKLDANAFNGLCTLVVNADRIFPLTQDNSIESQVNLLLNSKLHEIEESIRTESNLRSLRIGDQKGCILK
jgi:multisubunit Na+/H+ antiporter MnhG subunit